MKGCQHVNANCRGFTIHSAVSSATGNPLNFSVERSGDTSTSVYNRMVRFMFDHTFTNGGAIHEALRGVTFCSDRGYWDPTVSYFYSDLLQLSLEPGKELIGIRSHTTRQQSLVGDRSLTQGLVGVSTILSVCGKIQ